MIYIVSTMQTLAYFLFYLPVRILYRPQRIVAPTLKHSPRGRFIIAANHQCQMDPFLILSQLPFSTFLSLLPFRFITADKYMNTWWKHYSMTALGCFPITPKHKDREEAVEYSAKLLRKGQTLFIFPEGKRVNNKKQAQAKRGVSLIARQANAKIIPVFIDGMNETQRKEGEFFQINFGTPIVINEYAEKPLTQAQQIMQYIYRLPLNPQAYYGPQISFRVALTTLRQPQPLSTQFQLVYSAEDDMRSIDMTNHVLVPTVAG